MMGRSEVWRWSKITWSHPEDMENRKMMAIIAIWWCYREETQEKVVEWRVSFSISF